jgi:hypothetical protein
MTHILSTINHNERDELISFYERGHKYEIRVDKKSKYTSVTTWNHSHFAKFDADAIISSIFKSKAWLPGHKYWGQSAEEIKTSWKNNGIAASTDGTRLHSKIEKFMNSPFLPPNYTHKELYDFYQLNNVATDDDSIEWRHFINFIKEYPDLKPYRTEWMIFNEELKIAGSIDMVYENPDGTLEIYDWKRCKDIIQSSDWNKRSINPLIEHIHDTNFWHYSLQLNTYKTILEEKYGKIVTKLCLVRLHPDADNYELLEVSDLKTEMSVLFEARRVELEK